MWKMSEKSTDKENETSKKFKSFMGRTPSVIKSKFLSVLGNSTDIINGISNKVGKIDFYCNTHNLHFKRHFIYYGTGGECMKVWVVRSKISIFVFYDSVFTILLL